MLRFLSCFVIGCLFAFAEHAFAAKRYASIVVDADTLEIIHARQIDEQRFPASLTKVMTLYLTFDAINAGTLHLQEPLTVSRNAARTPPVSIKLRAGQTITVEQAIQALTVRSANDAAVVLAERIAGSEEAFAALMTAKARELKMQNTAFYTASGLPHPDQTTTARDMAKLGTAMLTNHSRYYHYFGQHSFLFRGYAFRNTNNLLHRVEGVDGLKTGFTNASGYNLIISAKRDGRRIVAVVLGGASGLSRDRHMHDLIDRGFEAIGAGASSPPAPVIVAEQTVRETPPSAVPEFVRLRGTNSDVVTVEATPAVMAGGPVRLASLRHDNGWAVQVGAFSDKRRAKAHLSGLSNVPELKLRGDKAQILPLNRNGSIFYRARFTQMSAQQAQATCRTLQGLKTPCMVIAPGA